MHRLLVSVVIVVFVTACGDDRSSEVATDQQRSYGRCEALAAPLEIDLPFAPEELGTRGDGTTDTTLPGEGPVDADRGARLDDARVTHALVALWRVQYHDVMVFLDPDASRVDLAAVAQASEAFAEGEPVTMERDDTYAEFLTVFAEDPQVTEAVVPEILPPSVRFHVSEPIDDPHVLESLDGVRQIVTTYDKAYPDALTAALLDDPDAVARVDALDDPLAEDAARLLDAARRWVDADDDRTRGGRFDEDEHERLRDAAVRVASGVREDCGVPEVLPWS